MSHRDLHKVGTTMIDIPDVEEVVFLTKNCINCNKSEELSITPEQWATLEETRSPNQAFPDRDPDYWEMFITGIHPECWRIMFPPDESEDD